MRVEVTIPGTVECYCIDERGDKRVATDELWLETYLCSVLRAYSYADDGSGDTIRKIMGVRRFNPVINTESEHRFLQAAEQLFFRGWQLGSDSMVQVPNNVSNHLTTGLMKYFHATGRFSSGINLFEKLRAKNVEVSSLLAKVLIMGNEEAQAVRVLHDAIKEAPMDYVMLDTQAEFLKNKAMSPTHPELKEERLKWALGCADRSTIAAPSEFGTWARLSEIYLAMEDWENALTTLNSCPMFTYQDKDAPIMPEPSQVYLPTLPETRLDEIDSEPESKYHDQVHPTLQNLRANVYKGTFKKAYSILTEMTAKIGWDTLLKIRSQVFVMEEEYRTERQPSAADKRNASIDVLRGTPDPTANNSERDPESKPATEANSVNGDSASTAAEIAAEKVQAPEETVNKEEAKAGNEDVSPPTPPLQARCASHARSGGLTRGVPPTDTFQPEDTTEQLARFNNKRLCERWLDSLFMVLYEDLRIYTIWRTEMAQYRAQSMQYKKSAEEWEILGSLATRLHHPAEAAEAYRACLAIRFSPKALKGIIGEFEKEHNTRETVQGIIRLVAWQYRWYSEFSPELALSVRRLIEDEGGLKVRSMIQASGLGQGVLDLTHHYAALCAAFRSSGTEA